MGGPDSTIRVAAAVSMLENSSVVSTCSRLSPCINGAVARQVAKPSVVVAATPATLTLVIVLASFAVPVTSTSAPLVKPAAPGKRIVAVGAAVSRTVTFTVAIAVSASASVIV